MKDQDEIKTLASDQDEPGPIEEEIIKAMKEVMNAKPLSPVTGSCGHAPVSDEMFAVCDDCKNKLLGVLDAKRPN